MEPRGVRLLPEYRAGRRILLPDCSIALREASPLTVTTTIEYRPAFDADAGSLAIPPDQTPPNGGREVGSRGGIGDRHRQNSDLGRAASSPGCGRRRSSLAGR